MLSSLLDKYSSVFLRRLLFHVYTLHSILPVVLNVTCVVLGHVVLQHNSEPTNVLCSTVSVGRFPERHSPVINVY